MQSLYANLDTSQLGSSEVAFVSGRLADARKYAVSTDLGWFDSDIVLIVPMYRMDRRQFLG